MGVASAKFKQVASVKDETNAGNASCFEEAGCFQLLCGCHSICCGGLIGENSNSSTSYKGDQGGFSR